MFSVFISEGGPECFKEQQDGVRQCIEEVASKYVPAGSLTPSMANLVNATCDDVDVLKKCVVAKLEQCENTTPGNLAESMFKVIKKECMGEKVNLVSRVLNLKYIEYYFYYFTYFFKLAATRGYSNKVATIQPFSTAIAIMGTAIMILATKMLI